MSSCADTFTASVDTAADAVSAIPSDVTTTKQLDDDTLLHVQRRLAELRHALDARASVIAGEIGHRSRRDLGYRGLAQREGFRTAEKLVQDATGSTSREATTLVTVGTMVHDAMAEPEHDPATGAIVDQHAPREPWLKAVGAAVADGTLSVEAATAIRSGLGEPRVDDDGRGVTADALASAAGELIADAARLNVDDLFKLARTRRDELDAAGIAERERAMYEQRSLRRVKRANGLSRFILDPDLEMSAYLDDVYDKLTSPRRGGPRFVDPDDRAWAESIATDTRTTEQYLHDAITGLLRLGVDADRDDRARAEAAAVARKAGRGAKRGRSGDAGLLTPRIVGSRVPSVRILVTEEALTTRTGGGHIEGSAVPISLESVDRAICTGGTVPLAFLPDGSLLDLGRETRLFTGRQKIALAARDGGCLWPGCDRPPSWTESHHINQWERDNGKTDVRDGVLLCRHHHMLLHNNGWRIVREESAYWLIPPPDIDARQVPRPMPSKSRVLQELLRA